MVTIEPLVFYVLSNAGYISGISYVTSVTKQARAEGYGICWPLAQQRWQAQWSPTRRVVIDGPGE